jgi:hypothetical protein
VFVTKRICEEYDWLEIPDGFLMERIGKRLVMEPYEIDNLSMSSTGAQSSYYLRELTSMMPQPVVHLKSRKRADLTTDKASFTESITPAELTISTTTKTVADKESDALRASPTVLEIAGRLEEMSKALLHLQRQLLECQEATKTRAPAGMYI